MTTPRNPDASSHNADESPSAPERSAAWHDADYRDENARLLADAMHRKAHALATEHATVPVQGYEILTDACGPSGAVHCGLLTTLWEHSPACAGPCPVCNNLVLALGFFGDDDLWTITGVCTGCGYLMQRTLPTDEFHATLDDALRGTPYTLPTRNQFLSSNGHQHTALLNVLLSLGEVVLPPPHYGFMCGPKDVMRRWMNPLRARAMRWAGRATARHLPTGARVEHNDGVYWPMVETAYVHLKRTGMLPELEQWADHQLQFCYPMISQGDVTLPPRARAEGESWQEADEEPDDCDAFSDDDEARQQHDIDALIASWRAGAVDTSALQRVVESLEAQNAQYEGMGDDPYGAFLGPDAMVDAFESIDDDQVREALELTGKSVTRAQRMEFFEQFVLPGLLDDADLTRLFQAIVLTSSTDDSVLLVAGVRGYSFTVLETEWEGPFDASLDFAALLRSNGWVETVEEFQRLPAKRKSQLVTRSG